MSSETRCAFCQKPIVEGIHVAATNAGQMYHEKCFHEVGVQRKVKEAEGRAETVKLREEQRRKEEEAFKGAPKTLATITMDEKAGFVIDPVTGKKKASGTRIDPCDL